THQFSLVQPAQAPSPLDQLRTPPAKLLDANSATVTSIGRQAGASMVALMSLDQYIYTTKVSKFNEVTFPGSNEIMYYRTTGFAYHAQLTLNVKLANVKTGRIAQSFDIKSNCENGFTNDAVECSLELLQDKLKRELKTHYPTVAHIVKAKSDTEYILDIGAGEGIEIDDKMTVFNEGKNGAARSVLGEGVITQLSGDIAVLKVSQLNGPIELGKTKVESHPPEKSRREKYNDGES
ncbi:MAG: hypothetical protein JO171_13690, partial [Paludibacterium sp.]|uniref:hypothetical protein n=1 Tax=Paludibacterium sp. TaxID=1917523 RepID=UPI0025FF99D2